MDRQKYVIFENDKYKIIQDEPDINVIAYFIKPNYDFCKMSQKESHDYHKKIYAEVKQFAIQNGYQMRGEFLANKQE